MKNSLSRLTRRKAIGLLGMGTGVGLLSRAEPFAGLLAASPQQAVKSSTGKATFPKGAIIRTLFKDLPPESLNGTILFHEHLDGVYSRNERQLKLPPPSSQDITP